MLKILTAAAVLIIMITTAQAAEISTDFVGEWCFSGADSIGHSYSLPSWQNGECNQILSISKRGLNFIDKKGGEENIPCDVTAVQYSKDTAPSGTGYTTKVRTKCMIDGKSKAIAYELYRYKGTLWIKD